MLEVDHCRLGAGVPHLIGVVGIADKSDDLVAAL
jgi:hypothetical protein